MKKIYLIGGGDYRTNEVDSINKRIASEANKDNFLIVPYATKKEKRKEWFEAIRNSFLKFRNFNFEILSEEDSVQKIKEKVGNAGIIFFTGGSPEKIIDGIKRLNIGSLFSNFEGVLVGYSAGALAFSKYCFVSEDEDYERTMIIEGLGLVDLTVSVHYTPNEDKELSLFSDLVDIYAISDQSLIIISSKKIDYIGEVFFFKKGLKIKK